MASSRALKEEENLAKEQITKTNSQKLDAGITAMYDVTVALMS